MPRLQVIDPANADGRVKEIFEGPLKGKHFNIFKGLGNARSGLEAYLSLNQALSHSSLSAAEKEAIALIVGEKNNCDYCLAAHTAIGKGHGLTEDKTVQIRKGDATGDDRIDAIVTFVSRIVETNGFATNEDLNAFKAAGFDDANVVDVIVAYTLNVFTNTFNHINDTAVDFPTAPALA
jgi:uncharacterized peroxidase-related enzyme